MTLVAGRTFDARDAATAPAVVVINQVMATQYWPSGHVVGRRLKLGGPKDDARWRTIVGVVRDVKSMGVDQPVRPEMYFPLEQSEGNWMWPRDLVVRADGDPLALTGAIREAIWSVDPSSARLGRRHDGRRRRQGSRAAAHADAAARRVRGPRADPRVPGRLRRAVAGRQRAHRGDWPSHGTGRRTCARCCASSSATGCGSRSSESPSGWRPPGGRHASCRACCSVCRHMSPGSTPGWPRCSSQCRLWRSTCPRDARARSTRSSRCGCSSTGYRQGEPPRSTRAGAPLPPLTFTGATTTVKPRVGTAARLATFSML